MFPIYPPIINGHTVSNLLLVDDSDKCLGFAAENNSRDVFLNVNTLPKTDNQCLKQSTRIIIHEVTHNILTKFISEKSSVQLDNLFDNKKVANKISWKLFKLRPVGNKQENQKKRAYSLSRDFWLSPTKVRAE